MLAERQSRRTDVERQRHQARHEANVEGFKSARVIEEQSGRRSRSRSDNRGLQ
jgi:hypothetical protein